VSLGEWIAPAFRLGGSLLNGIASFFISPRLEVVQSKAGYGRLKFGGVREDQYIVRVLLRFLNASQRPVLVRNVTMKLGTLPLADRRLRSAPCLDARRSRAASSCTGKGTMGQAAAVRR
jgi:hypothetical protein